FMHLLMVLLHYRNLPYLNSYPTRRSSDLTTIGKTSANFVHCTITSTQRSTTYLEQHLIKCPVIINLQVVFRVVVIGINWLFHVIDRKSTRLNYSHVKISYAVFCLKK